MPYGEGNTQSFDTKMEPRISISVVIAWVNALELIRPGLDSLAGQLEEPDDEIIIVTRHDEEHCRILQKLYPNITVVAAPHQTPITTLRSMGAKRARGDVVAITEDHCVPDHNWLYRIRDGMGRDGCDIVGGPVENASIRRFRDWAAFLTEYAGAVRAASDETNSENPPGNNVAYKRYLVAGLCATLDRGLWESFYHRQLADNGVVFRHDREMIVYHCRPFNFWYFVKQRYHFCRSFAAMRRQTFRGSDRVKYGVGSLVLPPVLVLRGMLALSRKGRLVGRYASCLPLISIYMVIGALGEMIGYFQGGGNSLVRVE